jgi:hypothetical protein
MYWWNSEHKVAIIEIPKNASSSFRENFKDLPSLNNVLLWKNNEAEEIIVVFRDPYERFISALNQFMNVHHWKNKDNDPNSMIDLFPLFETDYTNDAGKFNVKDIHFALQIDDIHHNVYRKYPEKYTFFWMGADIVLDVQTYLWNKYKITPSRYGKIHANRGELKIIKSVDERLVRNTYKRDYEFFEKITKVHGWENK